VEWTVVATLTVCFMVGAQAWAVGDPFSAPVAIARRNDTMDHHGERRMPR
jgi:hypothetical protein